MAAAPDTDVLRRAAAEQRVLISADTDFGELLSRSRAAAPSVLLLRRQQQRRAVALFELITVNLPTIAADLEAGAIVVFDDTRIRVRNLPITT